jgi:WD40 repeat protein
VFAVDKGGLSGVCFSPDGKRLLTVSTRGWSILDAGSGKELMGPIRAHDSWMSAAAFSPDGKRVVSGDHSSGVVRVWDAASGEELHKYQGPTGKLTRLTFLPDGNRIICEKWAGMVTSVAFFPDGKRVASAHSDGTVRVWRASR